MSLSKKQKEAIERLARSEDSVSLYCDWSLSGESLTLRYRRRWVEMGRYGPSPRSESHMILSVRINQVRIETDSFFKWTDDPKDLEKYNSLCKEADELFRSIRPNAPSIVLKT